MADEKASRRAVLRTIPSGVLGVAGVGGSGRVVASEGGRPDSNGERNDTELTTRQEFSQVAKLAATDGDEDDFFSESVAISGDGTTGLIGAERDEDPNGEEAGAAYVFEQSDGTWTQRAKLAADSGDSGDRFGTSIAVSRDGTTALVGSYLDEDPNGKDAGAAYVFEESGGTWTQRAKLTPDDGDSGDSFGVSVAMSGDGTTALICAYLDQDPNGYAAGAAYIFEESGGTWTQQTKLAAGDGDSEDHFGYHGTMSGDGTTALVGAPLDEDPNGEDAGAAYVFDRSGGAWTQQAKLVPDDGDPEDWFGVAVTMSDDGTTALIGAYQDEDPNGNLAGTAYVFEQSGGAWVQQAKLVPDDGDAGDTFGWSVALSGDGTTALIGAEHEEDPNGKDAGAAYVFARSSGAWTQRAKLAPDDGDPGDSFGARVAVSGDGTTALVGALLDGDPNGTWAGAAYVFKFPEGLGQDGSDGPVPGGTTRRSGAGRTPTATRPPRTATTKTSAPPGFDRQTTTPTATTVATPGSTDLERQEGSNGESPGADGASTDNDDGLPILTQFGDSGTTLGLGLGALGVLGGGGYLAYRRSTDDSVAPREGDD